MLARFAAAFRGDTNRVRRIAAILVAEESVTTLAIAAERVAHHLAMPTILENDE